jgi:hypothetical protein
LSRPFTNKIYSAAASKKNDDALSGSGSGSGSGSTPAKSLPEPSATQSQAPTSAQPTPASPARQSARLSSKKSHEALRQPGESYAQAANRTPSPDADALAGDDKQTQPIPGQALPSQTPRARRIRKESGEKGVGSPARMTRSRSRGVGLGDETD